MQWAEVEEEVEGVAEEGDEGEVVVGDDLCMNGVALIYITMVNSISYLQYLNIHFHYCAEHTYTLHSINIFIVSIVKLMKCCVACYRTCCILLLLGVL